MADDRRNGEEFEQISNDSDRDRNESGRVNEEAIGGTADDEFEDVDEFDEEEESLSQGSE